MKQLFCGIVDDATFLCRNFASGSGSVHDIDQESMNRISLGSQQFDKTQ